MRLGFAAAGLALLASLSFVALDAHLVSKWFIEPARRATPELSSAASRPEPGAAPIPYYMDFDGYYYVSYAREMAATGVPRVRFTHLENAPHGRPVYWSAAFSWWLLLLGAVDSAVTGLALPDAIAAAAYVASPLLFAVLLVAAAAVLWRRVGPLAASCLPLLLATNPRLLDDFGFARPDHHGLHLLLGLGTLLCAVLGGGGWVSTSSDVSPRCAAPPLPRARRWFAASALFGGCGLWAGAVQLSLLIGSLGAAAAIAALCFARPAPAPRGVVFEPALWRFWARIGAATSLLAYAFEYLPAVAMRLEVIHPLYPLAWLCGGELIYRVAAWGRPGERRAPLGVWVLLLAGALWLPLAILVGPVEWFWPRDPRMLRFHALVGEFLPAFGALDAAAAVDSVRTLVALVTVAVVGTLGLLARRLDPVEKTLVTLPLLPAWLFAALLTWQARWLGFFCIAAASVLPALLLHARRLSPIGSRGARAARAALVAALTLHLGVNLWWAGRLWASSPEGRPVALAHEIELRDIGLAIAREAHTDSPRVMTGLVEGATLHFFSSARGVGSPFWQNQQGVRDTLRFFAASDDRVARRIARARGLDYVLVPRDPGFVATINLVEHGEERVGRTIGSRLVAGREVPEWLEPFPLRDSPASERWRLYRVLPEPTP